MYRSVLPIRIKETAGPNQVSLYTYAETLHKQPLPLKFLRYAKNVRLYAAYISSDTTIIFGQKDNIKMDLQEIGWGSVAWIDLAQDM